jgi:hypothetical protein
MFQDNHLFFSRHSYGNLTAFLKTCLLTIQNQKQKIETFLFKNYVFILRAESVAQE